MRIISGIALILLTTTACLDLDWEALFDDLAPFSDLFIVPDQWSSIYAPGLDVVTAFPELADTTEPRFESTDEDVVEVRLFRQAIDEPQFWAARLRTKEFGDAEIRLWDGDVLVRTESVRVAAPYTLDIDLQVPEPVPAFARSATIPLALVELGRAPGVARIRDSAGSTMVAGGLVFATDDLTLDESNSPNVSLWDDNSGRVLSRRERQLNSGDAVIMDGGVGIARMSVSAAGDGGRGFIYLTEELTYESADAVTALEVLTMAAPEAEGTWVVVYGRADHAPERRIMGLNPTVTVDGSATNVIPIDGVPWIAAVAAEQGTVGIRWRRFFYSISL